jgi:ABC-type histidine transport system ATPase subunit
MPATAPATTARRDEAAPPLLQIESLAVRFGSHEVLRDISIELRAGDT